MNLNKLKHAVALAEQGNFARAASQVHLSQPALSRSISSLEDELGMRLFDRDQAGAAATPAGKQLVGRARDLLYAANNLQHEMALLRDCETGEVRFGTGPFPAASFLPLVLTELAVERPRMRTIVEVNNSEFLLEHLKAEHLEFFIADIRTVSASPQFRVSKLGRQYAGFFCRAGHPLLKHRKISVSDLPAYSFATVRLTEQLQSLLRVALGLSAGEDLPLTTVCDSIYVLKHIATHSDTILICTHEVVQEDVNSGALVHLKPHDLRTSYADIGVVSLERRSLSPMAELVLGKTRDIMSRKK